MEMTRREDRFLIVSYSRGALGQTGDGHFAPISGYHPERDLVLILDTARFKYPPHWVSLPQLFESMKAVDNSTGQRQ
jgi:glutathione gamma-glutamylcysteinyltransferase